MPTFTCSRCDLDFENLGDHSKHQRSHKFERNFSFYCAAPNCGLQFTRYKSLNVHLTRSHHEIARQRNFEPGPLSLRCSVPGCVETFRSSVDLCHHVLQMHSNRGEMVRCPLAKHCSNLGEIVNLASHLSNYHPGWKETSVDVGNQAVAPPPPELEPDSPDENEGYQHVPEESEASQSESQEQHAFSGSCPTFDETEHNQKQSLVSALAKFYLMMESEQILSIATVQKMSEGFAKLLNDNLEIVKKRLVHELKEVQIHEDTAGAIVNRVMQSDALNASHDKSVGHGPWFSTDKLRKSYYRKHFKYVEPIQLDLSFDAQEPTFVQYVPVEETLHVMFACPTVQKDLDASFEIQSQPRDTQVLEDYYDGLVYKRRASETEKTVDLFLFQDGFKTTTDLSKAASKHSCVGIYLALGNLKPYRRAQVDSLQLVMLIPQHKKIFNDPVLRKRCFERLVNDLKKLESDGIIYKGESVKVVLQFLIGDNLGQHEIGGFIGSFSAEYFCRHCTITRTKYHKEPWAREPLRTPQQFEEDMIECTRLHGNDANIVHYQGVKWSDHACPFNELNNFHVCDPAMPPCIAHDVLAGVLEQDLAAIIKMLLRSWGMSYEELNFLINDFHCYGRDSRNKPAEVPKSGSSLGGNAVQNWTLLRLFPFIVKKNRIDPDNQYWKLFLSLKEICEYIFAPSISVTQLADMKVLIENYEDERQILGFKRPKGHFVAHFGDLSILFGPLKHLWTLRFESLHSFFRDVMRAANNFKQPGKTMADKHSLYLAYMSAGQFFKEGTSDPKNVRPLRVQSIENRELQLAVQQQCFSEQAVEVDSVCVDGLDFKKSKKCGWLLLGNLGENDIHVGRVECIIIDNDRTKLFIETYIAKPLQGYGVYAIGEASISLICRSPAELKYPCLEAVYQFGTRTCISLQNVLSWDSDISGEVV